MADNTTLQTTTPPKTVAQRGWRTFFQTAGGSLVGLVLAVWNVPGVPDAINAYATAHFLPLFLSLLGLIGIPTAIVALVQNYLEAKSRRG